MKHAILLAIAVSSLAASTLAQSPSITLGGAVLRLGMTQAQVNGELASQPSIFLTKGGSITNEPESAINNSGDSAHLQMYGDVAFDHGHLSRIEKFWRPTDSPDTSLAYFGALFGATSAIVGTDGKLCSVRTWTGSEPDQDYKEIAIECDLPGARRSIHAFLKTFHFGEKDIPDSQVSEVLESR